MRDCVRTGAESAPYDLKKMDLLGGIRFEVGLICVGRRRVLNQFRSDR